MDLESSIRIPVDVGFSDYADQGVLTCGLI